ncbi:MAG TPA: hypothetical protein EYP23_03250 [Thermoplasmata archaeon]|nr:hypothetical protein [Thermoplasmata archaeon]
MILLKTWFSLFSPKNTSSVNTCRAYLGLTRRFKVTPYCLMNADEKELSKAIRPGGLHRVKAKRIKEIARYVSLRFNGNLTWVYSEPK